MFVSGAWERRKRWEEEGGTAEGGLGVDAGGGVETVDADMNLKEERWNCETTLRKPRLKKGTNETDFKHFLINRMENSEN